MHHRFFECKLRKLLRKLELTIDHMTGKLVNES